MIPALGFVKLDRAFPASWIARVVRPEIAGPLAEPAWLAHPEIAPILTSVLGDNYIVGRVVLDGAIERTALFGDPRDLDVPVVGLALHVALTAGTLHLPTQALELAPGDSVLYDTRLRVEPPDHRALVTAYYRHWYREPLAATPPVAISLVTFLRLPASQRHLFSWRFDRYAKLRPRLFVDRFLRKLPGSVQDRLARRR